MRHLTRTTVLTLAAALGAALAACPAHAATIDWQAPTDVTSAADILNAPGSTTVLAVDPVATTPTNVTPRQVNGITFTPERTTVPFTASDGVGRAATFYSGDTGNADLNSLLADAIYSSPAHNGTATLTLSLTNLTAGQQYAVQLFTVDDRSAANGRLVDVDSDPDSQNIDYSQSRAVSLVGYFTADDAADTLTINFTGDTDSGSGDSAIILNGYQVRTVPEPASGALVLLGLGGLLMLPRRRKRSC